MQKVFFDELSDLHLHLNGSFSEAYLQQVAKKNNCIDKFLSLKQAQIAYRALISTPNYTYTEQSIRLIWQQFALIHQIIQTLDDIKYGTADVIENSAANYLEIRSRPKQMQQHSVDDYIDAFIEGLILGVKNVQSKKLAYGLLSIDKVVTTAAECYATIDRVVKEKAKHGLLVGIDFSGDPSQPHQLTDQAFKQVLAYALAQNIGVAVHIGETEHPVELQTVKTTLAVLTDWYEKNKVHHKNIFHGKVRLGHCIYLTSAQHELIKNYQIPIEICPASHEQTGWWQVTNPHVALNMYPDILDPVVWGTDDQTIFNKNAVQEFKQFCNIFSNKHNSSKTVIKQHQAKFRFTNS